MAAHLAPGRVAPLYAPPDVVRRALPLLDAHMDRGLHITAGSGSGKSLTLGYLAFWFLLRGIPQVLFDPSGPMTDQLLLRLASGFSRPIRQKLWRHVVYLDMAGRTASAPRFPLLFRLPGDTHADVADRFLQTCLSIDPHLQSASIQGNNALRRIGWPVGIVLSALGLQLDAAVDLLDRPEAWQGRLEEAAAREPEIRPAVAFLLGTYMASSPASRQGMSATYRGKLEPLILDPRLRAMFCTAPASLDLPSVVANRQTVIADFRGETNPRARLFKTRWVFDVLLAYIRHRGAGRHRPFALHIDEVTELTNQASLDQDLFAADLDYLLNVLCRNSNVWATIAHQQLWQLSERTQETLLSMGTQMIGVVSDFPSAEALAKRYWALSPHRVKRWRNVWMSSSDPQTGAALPFVVEQEPVDFPLDEQAFLAARAMMGLRPFEFLVKPRDEMKLTKVSLAADMDGLWPTDHPALLAQIRGNLGRRLCPPDGGEMPPSRNDPSDTLDHNDNDDGVSPGHDDDELDPSYWRT